MEPRAHSFTTLCAPTALVVGVLSVARPVLAEFHTVTRLPTLGGTSVYVAAQVVG